MTKSVQTVSQQASLCQTEGRTAAQLVMSDEERQFASENHNLILSYLRRNHWDVDEYYDIAAWGYLTAVMRYFRIARLRKFPFSSIAWKAMKHSITVFRRTEARRLETEQRYIESVPSGSEDLFSELEADLLLHDLASNFDEKQYELATMRLQGYSLAEIAQAQGMPQQRVSKLLKALYRVYLKLYKK